MEVIGQILVLLAIVCTFIAMYYVNFRYDFKRGFAWLAVTWTLIGIMFAILLQTKG